MSSITQIFKNMMISRRSKYNSESVIVTLRCFYWQYSLSEKHSQNACQVPYKTFFEKPIDIHKGTWYNTEVVVKTGGQNRAVADSACTLKIEQHSSEVDAQASKSKPLRFIERKILRGIQSELWSLSRVRTKKRSQVNSEEFGQLR